MFGSVEYQEVNGAASIYKYVQSYHVIEQTKLLKELFITEPTTQETRTTVTEEVIGDLDKGVAKTGSTLIT